MCTPYFIQMRIRVWSVFYLHIRRVYSCLYVCRLAVRLLLVWIWVCSCFVSNLLRHVRAMICPMLICMYIWFLVSIYVRHISYECITTSLVCACDECAYANTEILKKCRACVNKHARRTRYIKLFPYSISIQTRARNPKTYLCTQPQTTYMHTHTQSSHGIPTALTLKSTSTHTHNRYACT